MHWNSKVPKKIKRNIIYNDLQRARKIGSSIESEINAITEKYENANYPKNFVSRVVQNFKTKQEKQENNENRNEDKETKPFFPIKLPYCEKNEKVARGFLKKLNEFTGCTYAFMIVWQTRKVKTLFPTKDRIKYKANVIYEGTVEGKPEKSYIGETKLIAEARWNQHRDPKHDSAPAKYIRENPNEEFTWKILSMSTSDWNKRKIHEALLIDKHKPSMNKQVEHRKLILFKNGVT